MPHRWSSSRISRRQLVGGGAAAVGGGVAAALLAGAGTDEHSHAHHENEGHARLRVLRPAEAALVCAMADRVFPPDADSPGATEIGVVQYLDGQLAGDWGAGARFYRDGPFHEPYDPALGYQLPLTPRELYQHVLPRIDEHARRRHGDVVAALQPEDQDHVMNALETGKVELDLGPGYGSTAFFNQFLQNVKEGLFADPIYGGNRNVAGWKWLDYPGDPMVYDDSYFYFFSSWQAPYDVEPRGLAASEAQMHWH
jgi:gluconate 2-dehydrogenase gamma chain